MTPALKASARTNRRYLLIVARSKEQIEQTILSAIGSLGWATAAPMFVIPQRTQHVSLGQHILAVDRGSVEPVRAAFELSSEPIKILRVSGTLKGLLRN